MNIAITGCTGTVGAVLTDLLLKECKPGKVALFCRDDQNLPTQIQSLCKVPTTAKDKIVYSYEIDFLDPLKTTNKVH